jgi:hypothetical protein
MPVSQCLAQIGGVTSVVQTIHRAVSAHPNGTIACRPECHPYARQGPRWQRVAATVINVTSFLGSLLVIAVAGHLPESMLGKLPEEIILVVASFSATACVIASLLIHGRKAVFWVFFCGFNLNALAQANDDLYLKSIGLALFVGPLVWNAFALRCLIAQEVPGPRPSRLGTSDGRIAKCLRFVAQK